MLEESVRHYFAPEDARPSRVRVSTNTRRSATKKSHLVRKEHDRVATTTRDARRGAKVAGVVAECDDDGEGARAAPVAPPVAPPMLPIDWVILDVEAPVVLSQPHEA